MMHFRSKSCCDLTEMVRPHKTQSSVQRDRGNAALSQAVAGNKDPELYIIHRLLEQESSYNTIS